MRKQKTVSIAATSAPAIINQKTEDLAAVFIKSGSAFGEISADVVESLKDKKLSTFEAIEILMDLPSVIQGVKDVTANARKFKSLTEGEKNAVYEALGERLNQSTDRAAKIVAGILDFAVFVAVTLDKANSKIVNIKKLFAEPTATPEAAA